jgi:hypothetical protein
MNDEYREGTTAELYCAHNPNKKFCNKVVANIFRIKRLCISYIDRLVYYLLKNNEPNRHLQDLLYCSKVF